MTSLNNPGTLIVMLLFAHLFLSPMSLRAHNPAAAKTTKTVPSAQDEIILDEIDEEASEIEEAEEPRRVNEIFITGNKQVPTEAILDRIPFAKGEIFDPLKTRTLIQNLYFDLKRFRNITVNGENVGKDLINIHIVLDEKKILKEVVIEGNKQVTRKEIFDKINFNEIPAIDEEELKKYSLVIQKIYKEKGFHQTEIKTSLRIEDENRATAVFQIEEKPKSIIKRICFKGNAHMSSKKLRNIIFSREDWLGSFMDKSGTYQEDRINGDKHMLEQFYQNNGYLNAKVVDVETTINPATKNIVLTYEIREGDCYTIKDVKVSGNDILKEEFLLSVLPVRPGDVYSRERLVDAMKALEFIWGDFGYIYASINPDIQTDDENKTVSISFDTDLGSQVFLNKITIRGNKKTRDKIIRRKISLEEGLLITNSHMDASKSRVESLGYFDQRDGVNWKLTRLSENSADLDLFLKEIKTGDAHLKIGFGGSATSLHSPTSSVSVEGNVSDTNFGGSGVMVNLATKLGTDEKTVIFNVTQPWLFDKPIYGSLDLYHKRFSYDQFTMTQPINEKFTGGKLTTGFVTGSQRRLFNDTFVRLGLGVDNVNYGTTIIDDKPCPSRPRATIPALCDDATGLTRIEATLAYDSLLAKLFEPGTFTSLTAQIGQDKKNHPMHPSSGYAWIARSLFVLPSLNSRIGFNKVDIDVNWYTPLIGDFDLIFRLHGYVGLIIPLKNRVVPYRELFHIGGPASVRGFLFGQIGPQFTVSDTQNALRQDSIGGDKTAFVNAELIFPILSDFSMKGLVFYDGGTGWDNPYVKTVSERFIRNNNFDYRHSVGVGLRILNPVPMRIDWGFKLDPRKGETGYEVHFGMQYDW